MILSFSAHDVGRFVIKTGGLDYQCMKIPGQVVTESSQPKDELNTPEIRVW